jgi:hypothetical protein
VATYCFITPFRTVKFYGVPSGGTVKVWCAVGKKKLQNTVLEDGKATDPISRPSLIWSKQLLTALKISDISRLRGGVSSLCSMTCTGSTLSKLYSCLVIPDKPPRLYIHLVEITLLLGEGACVHQ